LVDAVVVQRVDTSRPWEHPDSLDPQIEIFAPDGFLPQNLVAWDDHNPALISTPPWTMQCYL